MQLMRRQDLIKISTCSHLINSDELQIDWDESAAANRVCIRPHINQELDNRKNIYHGIDTVLVGR
jgi:DNA mismatch repair protein MSH5